MEWDVGHSHGGFVDLLDNTKAANWMQVTSSASTNTKGSWTVAHSSTPYPLNGLILSVGTATANLDYLVDVGVGGSGSEKVILENFLVSGTNRVTHWVWIPVPIPAGSAVSIRCQCSTGSSDVRAALHGVVNGPWAKPSGCTKIIAIGANTSTSGGTSIDCGASANTFSSWVQISASIANDLAAIGIATGSQKNTAPANASFMMSVGVGSSSNEKEVIMSHRFSSSGTADYFGPHNIGWFPCHIPSGARLAAKCKSSTADATDRKFDLVLYGWVK